MSVLIIGRGREADVLQLVAPYRDGTVVSGDVVLRNIGVQSDAIRLELRDAAQQIATVVLRPQPGAPSFEIQVPPLQAGQLRTAAELLAAAVAHNDKGTFFATVVQPAAAIGQTLPVAAPVQVSPSGALAGVTAVLWAALALAMLAKAARKPRSWSAMVFGAVILGLAAAARRAAPFTPLHADDHAYQEIAIGLNLPEVQERADQLMHDYGPAWWQLQRWTTPIWGDDHQALGRWAAAVGALATVLAVLAARRSSGRWLPALVGGAAMCWAPIAVRVGNSESNLVVAQLLVAAALWLASPPYPARSGRFDALGVLAAIGLLACGHPLGPVYAVGAGLCAWALAVRPAQSADSGGELPNLAVLALPNPHRRMTLWPARDNLAVAAAGVALLALLVGWQWTNQQNLLGNRLASTGLLPVPVHFWTFELWWQRAWGAVTLTTVVAAAGLLGLWAQRRVHGRAVAWWSVLAWTSGLAALGVAGLVVVACVTDGVRYQAPMAAAWVVLAAFAPRCADLLEGTRRPLVGFVVVVAMAVALVEALATPAGAAAVDAQAQAYRILSDEVADEKLDFWLVVPERAPGERRHVVVDQPRGRFVRSGPVAQRISVNEYLQACGQGRAPTPAWVFLSPACAAADLPELATPCAALEPLLDPATHIRAGYVRPWQGVMAQGLPGEFHRYGSETVPWRLGRARCPTQRR